MCAYMYKALLENPDWTFAAGVRPALWTLCESACAPGVPFGRPGLNKDHPGMTGQASSYQGSIP